MKESHSTILHTLKEFKKPMSVSNLASRVKKDENEVRKDLDLLEHAGLLKITRKGSKKQITETQIIEQGISAFYNENKVYSKEDVQLQINKLKEAVETLNEALNTSTPEEKKNFLDNADKVQSVLNGAYQIFNVVAKML